MGKSETTEASMAYATMSMPLKSVANVILAPRSALTGVGSVRALGPFTLA